MLIQDWLRSVHNLLQPSPRSRRTRISVPIVASDVQLLESRVVLTAKPSAPSKFTAEATASDEVELAWRDVKNEKGYRIYIDQGDGWEELDTTRANAKSYTVTDLEPGTEYSFCVEAFNAGGARKSRSVTVTTPIDPPDAPEDLTADGVSESEIALSWSDVDNEDGYSIYQLVGRNWKLVGETEADETEYVVDGLDRDTEYTFYVSAFNDGGESDSEEVTGTTYSDELTAPDVTADAVSDTEIELTWGDVDGEEGYTIYQKIGRKWVDIGSANADETTFTVTDLDPDTEYVFYVEAFNADSSEDSDQVSATTLSEGGDGGDGGDQGGELKAEYVSDSSIKVTWGSRQNVDHFEVYAVIGPYLAQSATVDGSQSSVVLNNIYNDFGAEVTIYLGIIDSAGNVTVETTTLSSHSTNGPDGGDGTDNTDPFGNGPNDGGLIGFDDSPFGGSGL